MTSRAMGTGMITEIRLTRPSRNGVGSERSVCQGISVSIAAETRLANSMIVMVGLTNIHTFLPYSRASSLNTSQKGSEQSFGATEMAQASPSSPIVNGLRGLARSSQEMTPGTTTRITTSKRAYFVTLMV